ncbi:MAG: hypothetical protein ACREJM_09310 [Candidatus Saccharimonadales bacterium]
MADRGKQTVRKPATKLPQLQKKMNRNRYRARPIIKQKVPRG